MWMLIGATLIYLFNDGFGFGSEDYTVIGYSTFRQQVGSGNVSEVNLEGNRVRGSLREPIRESTSPDDTTRIETFETYVPAFGDDGLLDMLEEHQVEINTSPEAGSSPWGTILFLGLPFLLFIGIAFMMNRQMQMRGQGILSVGKSRAKLYDRQMEHTSFDDVAGADGAKQELREIVEFLQDPSRFKSLGGKVPKGVLLLGPPGTGKTLLARAVAGEAEAPFFSITGSDFMEMFVGVGASRVRDLFTSAKKSAPSIIFIDEIDSIGRHRGAGLGGGHDEREQTLNQLLSELDGFEPTQSVVVMAATNRPDILDPALLRPGRFDRRIGVDLPTSKERKQILELHARDKPLEKDVDLERVAQGTPGFSGADLDNLLNEAALLAARRNRTAIQARDIDNARDKVMMGLKRTGLALTDEEMKLLAHHEAGHAVVAAAIPGSDPIHKVTIVPRGRAMGVTQQLPEHERYVYKREHLLARISVMLGGRAAEDLIFQTGTNGAENDLKQATDLARRMVLDWGMSERMGPMAAGGQNRQVFLGEEIVQRPKYSEATAREVDEEVKRILDECYQISLRTLRENAEAFQRVAAELLEREEITGADVMRILKDGG
jgi:cell division protease FtsH